MTSSWPLTTIIGEDMEEHVKAVYDLWLKVTENGESVGKMTPVFDAIKEFTSKLHENEMKDPARRLRDRGDVGEITITMNFRSWTRFVETEVPALGVSVVHSGMEGRSVTFTADEGMTVRVKLDRELPF